MIVLLFVGSVATIKLVELIAELQKQEPERLIVRVVSTKSALHFFDPSELTCPCYTDIDEWSLWNNRGDPVLHIELRRWADCFLIAPLGTELYFVSSGIVGKPQRFAEEREHVRLCARFRN